MKAREKAAKRGENVNEFSMFNFLFWGFIVDVFAGVSLYIAGIL